MMEASLPALTLNVDAAHELWPLLDKPTHASPRQLKAKGAAPECFRFNRPSVLAGATSRKVSRCAAKVLFGNALWRPWDRRRSTEHATVTTRLLGEEYPGSQDTVLHSFSC